MTDTVNRVILHSVKEFKKYWHQKGPFKYALCSMQFPDEQLELEEWLFSNNSKLILKELMQWDQLKMKIVYAPIGKNNKENELTKDVSDWKIVNFPEHWIDWNCRSFSPIGYIMSWAADLAIEQNPQEIEDAFFKSFETTVKDIGYKFFKPLKDEQWAYMDQYLKEWQEDEKEDGRF